MIAPAIVEKKCGSQTDLYPCTYFEHHFTSDKPRCVTASEPYARWLSGKPLQKGLIA